MNTPTEKIPTCECGKTEGLEKVVCGYFPVKYVNGELEYEEVAEFWCKDCMNEEEEEEGEEEEGEEEDEEDDGINREYHKCVKLVCGEE